MKTYQVVFQSFGHTERIGADRYYIPEDTSHKIVTFYVGTGENSESIATFFLDSGDYVKMVEIEGESSRKCSEQDLSTQT